LVPVRERVLAALEAALAAVPGVTAKRECYDEVEAPALLLFDGDGHRIEQLDSADEAVTMQVTIVGVATGADAKAAAVAINMLHAQTVAALTGNAALSDLIEDVVETALRGSRPQRPEDAAEFHCAFECEFDVTYLRRRNDPYSFGG
jgi:hypothetical protein